MTTVKDHGEYTLAYLRYCGGLRTSRPTPSAYGKTPAQARVLRRRAQRYLRDMGLRVKP